MPRIFFPMIWFKQTAHIDDVIGPQLELLLLIPRVGTLFNFVILSLGISLLVILGVIFVTLKWRSDDEALYLVSQRPSQQSS